MQRLSEIAALLIGVAFVALLINRSQGTAQVIRAGGSTFNQLLRTVTLQNNSGFQSNQFSGVRTF